MKPVARASIYSGLIMPGLGQWALGFRARGAAIMSAVLALVILLGARIFLLVFRLLAPSGDLTKGIELDAGTISRIHSEAWTANWWVMGIIILIWIASVADARRLAKKRLLKAS